MLDPAMVRRAVEATLTEDAAADGITTRWSVPEEGRATATVFTRKPGVVTGLPVAVEVFTAIDPEVETTPQISDGTRVGTGDVLLKENHLIAAGGISAAVRSARAAAAEGRTVSVEIEVRDLAEAEEALRARGDWTMLDNMPLDGIEAAVRLRDSLPGARETGPGRSGTPAPRRLRELAGTGINAASAGAPTHSAPALDLSTRLEAG